MSTDGTEQTKWEKLLRNGYMHVEIEIKQHVQNVRSLGLLTCFCISSSESWFSVSLYPAIMLSKPLFSRLVSCRERQIIRSQMELGNRNKNKVPVRIVLTFPRKIYPAMAAPISMMTMREIKTAN